MRRKLRSFSRGLRERHRVLARQRAELDPQMVVAFGLQAAGDVAAGDEHHPGRRFEVLGDGVEQRNRGRIHQVYVLDLYQRGHDQGASEEANHDLAKLRRLRVARKLLDLGADGSRHIEHQRDQREPWQQLRVRARHLGAQSRQHDVRWVVTSEAEQRSQQIAPDRVRRLTRVDLAGCAEHRQAVGEIARFRQQTRLAAARLPDQFDQAAAASTSGFDGPAQLREIVVAADEREPGSLR